MCGKEFPTEIRAACDDCFGPIEVVYDLEAVRKTLTKNALRERNKNLWRYAELLPLEIQSSNVDLEPGYTPLRRAKNLGEALGLRNLYLKDETVAPTFSFKDRAAAVGVLKSIEFGLKAVGCASTGNLANAAAAAAAKAGLPCYIFVPSDLNGPKVQLALAYGARVIGIEKTYDDANRIANRVADRHGWGLLNINVRPYYVEGSKTIGLEIAEQLEWSAPDLLIAPLGSGALLCAVAKGIRELSAVGLLKEVQTSFSGSQPIGCSPIATAYVNKTDEIIPVEHPDTIAESLAIGDPASGLEALHIIRESGGFADALTDEEIVNAQLKLAQTEGVFAEPAGGVVVASLIRRLEAGEIDKDERVVLLITGSGLKSLSSVASINSFIPRVPSTMDAVEKVLGVA
ncbi:MAG: threonine synthase [Armatimonadota bacterium]